MSNPYEEDIASHALELLSATSTWLLVRHQWLIDNMRCLLTGESSPPLTELKEFDDLTPKNLRLPNNLMDSFIEMKAALEQSWLDATKSVHPMSGLTIFEQLDNFQALAHHFMQTSKEANQKLLQEFAMRDSLTGARTRLTLNANLFHELKSSIRSNEPCSIALIDHDNFKLINDRWGHIVGDQVLIKTADIFQKKLRHHDLLYRFGGDEWLIVMPNTTETIANTILERLQKACHSYEFKSSDNEPFFSYFSYGVAESSSNLEPKGWIALADQKLYKNKPRQDVIALPEAKKNQPKASVG